MHSQRNNLRIAPVGNAIDIAQAVNAAWQQHYPGNPNRIIWPPEFFEWQFLQVPSTHPAVCLGAYDGTLLTGIFCGDVWHVEQNSEETGITYLSCVAVRKGVNRHAASSTLLSAMQQWSQERGARAFYGFVNPSESGMRGRSYWTSRPGHSHQFMEGPKQWQLFPGSIVEAPEADNFAAACAPDRCAEFLEAWFAQTVSNQNGALKWQRNRLRHQLKFGRIADCIMVEDGKDMALCNFWVLPTAGNGNVAQIDFVATSEARTDLLKAAFKRACVRLHACDCRRIMTLGEPANRVDHLLALGFVPCILTFAPLVVSWANAPTFAAQSRLAGIYR